MTRTDTESEQVHVPIELALDAVLVRVTSSHRTAEAAIAERGDAIQLAVRFGATWKEIGQAVGMTRQAAHRHFARHVNGRP